jgi:hypothetical protein
MILVNHEFDEAKSRDKHDQPRIEQFMELILAEATKMKMLLAQFVSVAYLIRG